MWHYNWKMTSDVVKEGVEYIPMIKEPGRTLDRSVDRLPSAHHHHIGTTVKGWNEPDDGGQAGRDENLRYLRDPRRTAQQWTDDMWLARERGYTDFIGPAMAKDTCWLDHFLKACEETLHCKELITYLAFHRYRSDCASYTADPNSAAWRDDLSYVLSFYRTMVKYNKRGFNLKGLVWDELGCLASDYWTYAPQNEQARYMREWYANTIVAIKAGDTAMGKLIKKTPYIMPRGAGTSRDAHRVARYEHNNCPAEDGGRNAGAHAVRAIRSVVTVAWFSVKPQVNHLFDAWQPNRLSPLGKIYFDACKRVIGAAGEKDDSFVDRLDRAMDSLVGKVVRLAHAGRALYALQGQDWDAGFGADSSHGEEADWDIEENGNGYHIVNHKSRRVLYANNENWGAGIGAGSSVSGDGVWKFEPQGGGKYRIINELSGRCLYAATGRKGKDGLGAGSPASAVNDDGVWEVKEVGANDDKGNHDDQPSKGDDKDKDKDEGKDKDEDKDKEPRDCERCPVGLCDRYSSECHFYADIDQAYHCKVNSCDDVPTGEHFSGCWTWGGNTFYSVKTKDYPCK